MLPFPQNFLETVTPPSFCEAYMFLNANFSDPTYYANYFHGPEYINSYSSLVMFVLGLYGLFTSNVFNIVTKLLQASLVVTGVCSFFYHYTGWQGAGYMDTFGTNLILSVRPSVRFSYVSLVRRHDSHCTRRLRRAL